MIESIRYHLTADTQTDPQRHRDAVKNGTRQLVLLQFTRGE